MSDIKRYIEQTIQVARQTVAREKTASAVAPEPAPLEERSMKLAAVYDTLAIEGLGAFGSVEEIEKKAKSMPPAFLENMKGKGKDEGDKKEDKKEDKGEDKGEEKGKDEKKDEKCSEYEEKEAMEGYAGKPGSTGETIPDDDSKSTSQTQNKSQVPENEWTRQTGTKTVPATDDKRSVTETNDTPIAAVHKTASPKDDPAFHAMAYIYQAYLAGEHPEIDKIASAFELDPQHVQAIHEMIIEKEAGGAAGQTPAPLGGAVSPYRSTKSDVSGATSNKSYPRPGSGTAPVPGAVAAAPVAAKQAEDKKAGCGSSGDKKKKKKDGEKQAEANIGLKNREYGTPEVADGSYRNPDDGHDIASGPRLSDDSPPFTATGDGTYAPHTSPMTPFLDSASAATAFTKRQSKMKSSAETLRGLFKEEPYRDPKLHENLSATEQAGAKMSRS